MEPQFATSGKVLKAEGQIQISKSPNLSKSPSQAPAGSWTLAASSVCQEPALVQSFLIQFTPVLQGWG